jgi:hypothetical protein
MSLRSIQATLAFGLLAGLHVFMLLRRSRKHAAHDVVAALIDVRAGFKFGLGSFPASDFSAQGLFS